MRKIRFLVCIVFAVSCVLFVAYNIKVKLTEDRNPPVITLAEDFMVVSVGDEEAILLNGVTASDKEDGDITDQIQIASLSRFINGKERKVEYVVFDGFNNVATAERTITYDDYTSPRIYLKSPLRFTAQAIYKQQNFITVIASDVLDGDISDRVRVVYDSYIRETAGTYSVTFQVENSAGDICTIPCEMIIYDQYNLDEADELYPALSDYILYTKVGQTLDFSSYVTGVYNMYQQYEFGQKEMPADVLRNRIIVDSDNLDYNTPGIYTVRYNYTMPDGKTTTTNAYVVVEE